MCTYEGTPHRIILGVAASQNCGQHLPAGDAEHTLESVGEGRGRGDASKTWHDQKKIPNRTQENKNKGRVIFTPTLFFPRAPEHIHVRGSRTAFLGPIRGMSGKKRRSRAWTRFSCLSLSPVSGGNSYTTYMHIAVPYNLAIFVNC